MMTESILVPKTIENLSLTSFVGQDMSMEDIITTLKASKDPGNAIMSRLDGTYETYLKYMKDQHEKKRFFTIKQKIGSDR